MTQLELNISDLKALTIDQLNDQAVLNQIQRLASDPMYDYEPGQAREFYEAISELINKFSAQINGTAAYKFLQKILVQLQWKSLTNLPKKARESILSNDLIFAIKNQINPTEKLNKYLRLFEFKAGVDKELRQVFIYSLTHNNERLGNEQITLKSGETVSPQIGNWLKDFLSYTDPKSQLKGESYELTQYLYSSPNIKKLNAEDKQLLAQIIGIYNLLRSPKNTIGSEKLQAPPRPVAIPPPPKSAAVLSVPKTAFEQKLAKVSVPSPHGVDLEMLKKRVAQEKATTPRMTPQEIKREISTAELAAPKMKEAIATAPVKMTPIARPTPVAPSISAKPSPKLPIGDLLISSLNDIKTMDDLKKITIGNLRQGETVAQTQLIKSKINQMAAVNRTLPYFAVLAFEASPLFQAYLEEGIAGFGPGAKGSDLTKEEFEALADLRKQIEGGV